MRNEAMWKVYFVFFNQLPGVRKSNQTRLWSGNATRKDFYLREKSGLKFLKFYAS